MRLGFFRDRSQDIAIGICYGASTCHTPTHREKNGLRRFNPLLSYGRRPIDTGPEWHKPHLHIQEPGVMCKLPGSRDEAMS